MKNIFKSYVSKALVFALLACVGLSQQALEAKKYKKNYSSTSSDTKELHTKRIAVSEKAKICGDLQVKGDTKLSDVHICGTLDLCDADVIEPGSCNPFHGWWVNVGASIGAPGFLELGGRFAGVPGVTGPPGGVSHDEFWVESPLCFIDTRQYKKNGIITISLYQGTAQSFREVGPNENIEFLGPNLVKVIESDRFEILENGRVLALRDVAGSSNAVGIRYDNAMTIQTAGRFADENDDGPNYPYAVLSGWPYGSGNAFPTGPLGIVMKKVPSPAHAIQTLIDDAQFADTNDPVLSFTTALNYLLDVRQPETNAFIQGEFFIGRNNAKGFIQKMLTEGDQPQEVEVVAVRKSLFGSGTTTFVTKGFHGLTIASKVKLSGFTGQFAFLNNGPNPDGSWTVTVAGTSDFDPNRVSDGGKFFRADIAENIFSIAADTSQVTSNYSSGAKAQGNLVGPVRSDISYRAFIDAYLYAYRQIFANTSHFFLQRILLTEDFGTPSAQVIETWEEVKALAETQDWTNPTTARFVAIKWSSVNFYRLPVASNWYTNNALRELSFGELGWVANEPVINSGAFGLFGPAFGGTQIPGTTHIPKESYVDPTSVRYLWWRINPNTPQLPPEFHGIYNLPEAGYQHQGSRFEGLMSDQPPIGGSVPGYSPLHILFGAPFFDNNALFFCGLINPQYTSGHKIGYMYSGALVEFGEPHQLIKEPIFSDPNSPLFPHQGWTHIYAEAIKYLNSLGIDSLVIDIRNNIGGWPDWYGEFAGADRERSVVANNFQGRDFRRPIFTTDADFDIWGGSDQNNRTIHTPIDIPLGSNFFPSAVEAELGSNAVLKNMNIIILTNTTAVSGGDLFPRAFMGDNADGDIGNGVHVYIVNNINGVNSGENATPVPTPVNPLSHDLRDINGEPIPYLYGNSDGYEGLEMPPGFASDSRENMPGMIPVRCGQGGIVPNSPLSHLWRDTVELDFGFVVPHTNPISQPLPNFPNGGQPINDFVFINTWRDQVLEVAIRCAAPSIGQMQASSAHIKKAKDVLAKKKKAVPLGHQELRKKSKKIKLTSTAKKRLQKSKNKLPGVDAFLKSDVVE